jgi:hypothetical protein
VAAVPIASQTRIKKIGHMYIYTFMLRMTDTMPSQNIDLCSWDTLYSLATDGFVKQPTKKKIHTSEQYIKEKVT